MTTASTGTPRKVAATKPTGTTTSGAAASAAPTQRSLEQHLAVVAEGEVMDPQGLYEFLESLRALGSGMAFFVHAASSQLESAVRKGARDTADGRLTLRQKVELQIVLRKIARRLNSGSAEELLAVATGAVKTYALMEDFLESLESDNVSRPHRGARGGFSLGGR